MWSDRYVLSKEVFLFELRTRAEKTKMGVQIWGVKEFGSFAEVNAQVSIYTAYTGVFSVY